MKLSSQEEYGLRCLLYMARSGNGESRSIPEISRAEGLSIPNVAKLMRLLRLGGFVASVRGQAGGYRLARPPETITVAQVLETLGGTLFGPRFCERHAGVGEVCVHQANCPVRCLWNQLHKMVHEVLSQATLRDLLMSEQEMLAWLANRASSSAPPTGHESARPQAPPA